MYGLDMIYYDMVLICRLSTTFSQWPLEGDKDIGSGQANAQMCMMSVLDTKSQVGCVRMFLLFAFARFFTTTSKIKDH